MFGLGNDGSSPHVKKPAANAPKLAPPTPKIGCSRHTWMPAFHNSIRRPPVPSDVPSSNAEAISFQKNPASKINDAAATTTIAEAIIHAVAASFRGERSQIRPKIATSEKNAPRANDATTPSTQYPASRN